MAQTIVQDAKQIRFGEGKIEAGDNIGALVDLGAVSNVRFNETFETVDVIADSVGLIRVNKRNVRCRLTFDLVEINLANLETLRGDSDAYGTVAGTLVSNYPYVVPSGSWNYDKFIELDHQNADGSKPTIDSVVGSVNGALVLNTDYYVVKNEAGAWGIVVIDSATVTTEAQSITITYDYTPAASRYLSTGGDPIEIKPKVLRLTNTNADGENLQIIVYAARNAEGISLELPAYESGEPWRCPIVLEGRRDTSRSQNDQLFKIVDEQGV